MLSDCRLAGAEVATINDQHAIQRTALKDVLVLRRLGEGAYAYVDLVAVGAAAPKLCAGKLLLPPPPLPASAPPCALSRWSSAAEAARGPIKPTPPCMFSKQKAAYAHCAGSPFVVQLLAAKAGRGGHKLLLLEFAEHGSLAERLLLDTPQHHGTQQQPEPECEEGADGEQADGEGDDGEGEDGGSEQIDSGDLLIEIAVSSDDPQPDSFCRGATVVADATQQPNAHPPPLSSGHLQPCAAMRPLSDAQPQPPRGGIAEPAARFYAACALLALEWMHDRRMVHRDVKPDNMLLFSCGYLKLSDLGACCIVPAGHAPTTRTGTPAYMAPEVKAALPQCGAADLWSLGVTLWELVAGRLPGWAEDEGGHSGLDFPQHFSQELRCLLTRLLSHDPSGRPCVAKARAHGWFNGFDWEALRERRMAAPPVPFLGA